MLHRPHLEVYQKNKKNGDRGNKKALSVSIYFADKKVKRCFVHTLVAEAFLGAKPSPSHSVDHIDRDPFNNRLSNLRWATRLMQTKNRKSQRALGIKKLSMEELDALYKRTETESLSKIADDLYASHGIHKRALHCLLRFMHPKY